MKIIKLTAENVKRLKAVEIEPDGTLQVITGKNAQGKTSVLDAMWLALGGGTAGRETAKPIREGETSAFVTVDLGDLLVTRTWKNDKSTLKVTKADGTTLTSPQKTLDELVGRLSFDPLEFANQNAKDQLATLLNLVKLDFDLTDLETRRKNAYEERTLVGRDVKRAKGAVESLGTRPDVEGEPRSIASLTDELTRSEAAASDVRGARTGWLAANDKIRELEAALKTARNDLARFEELGKTASQVQTSLRTRDEIRADMATVEETNALFAARDRWDAANSELETFEGQYEELTNTIKTLDTLKAEGLARAEFPVEGLSFDEEGVLYQGVPFSQASGAERIRVSVAMAMAMNPKLRVLRILDGSLLDSDNMALIASMGADNDYQMWVERVEDDSETAVVISDGQVVS